MLGLGSNITGISKVGTTIVTDNLVLRHDYKMRAAEPLSSGAAVLDGDADLITIGDVFTFGTDDFSITAWVKVNTASTQTGESYIISKIIDANNTIKLAYKFSVNKFIITVKNDGNSIVGNGTDTGITSAMENEWIHVAATCDRNGKTKIYVNGSTDTYGFSGNSLSTTEDIDSSGDWVIGGNGSGSFGNFDGKICNVGIWKGEVLSQAQVKSIMNKNYDSLSASEKTDLVSWWNLDETLGDKGIVLDKDGAIGENLLDNADFANGQDDWGGFGSGNTTLLNGVVTLDGTSGVAQLGQGILTNGSTYEVEFTITDHNGDATNSEIIDNSGGSLFAIPGNGVYKIHFTLAYDNANITFRAKSGSKFSISNISVKLVNGNHGTLS